MDNPATVHQINQLTVVTSDSYTDFVTALQSEMASSLSARPKFANEAYFTGKVLKTATGDVEVSSDMAKQIYRYLVKHDYTDNDDKISQVYLDAKDSGKLADLPPELAPYAEPVLALIDSVYTDAQLPTPDNDRNSRANLLNDNFNKQAFRELWQRINRKAAYAVDFDNQQLIDQCIRTLNKDLQVSPLLYTVHSGMQRDQVDDGQLQSGSSFVTQQTATQRLDASVHSAVKYDLIGQLSSNTQLTRRTIARILQGIKEAVFGQYRLNPEDFIAKASRLINEQKATVIVEHLRYDPIADSYGLDIFTQDQAKASFAGAGEKMHKHIYDYVFTDSKVERQFAQALDSSTEVVVYAKLPKGFFIPTPVGNYNPDWAIAFQEGTVKHIYFVAETKGSLSSLALREIEQSKINCARRFFEHITASQVKYEVVDSYAQLMNLLK